MLSLSLSRFHSPLVDNKAIYSREIINTQSESEEKKQPKDITTLNIAVSERNWERERKLTRFYFVASLPNDLQLCCTCKTTILFMFVQKTQHKVKRRVFATTTRGTNMKYVSYLQNLTPCVCVLNWGRRRWGRERARERESSNNIKDCLSWACFAAASLSLNEWASERKVERNKLEIN
jgi:hypothetical protein